MDAAIRHLIHAAHAEHVGRGEAAGAELGLPQRPAPLQKVDESRCMDAKHRLQSERGGQGKVHVSLVAQRGENRVDAVRALAHRDEPIVAHFHGAGVPAMIV